VDPDPAFLTYEAIAGVYDAFTHSNDYERWLGQALLPELRRHGLRDGGKALDVGCGTGRAFRPLQRRGWQIHGCDLSSAMLEVAAKESSADVTLRVADMRSLPHLGDFDLVLSLNDSVNYLLGDNDLILALSGMRENLAGHGLLVFDVNTSSTFASGYSGERSVKHQGSRWVWTGHGEVAPSIFESEIAGDRLTEPIRHLERFRSEGEVREAMRTAGIETLAALGMSEADDKILLATPLDEHRDYKLVFIGAVASRLPRWQPGVPEPVCP